MSKTSTKDKPLPPKVREDLKVEQEVPEKARYDTHNANDMGRILGGGGYAGISAGDVVTSATGETIPAGGNTPMESGDAHPERPEQPEAGSEKLREEP